MERESSARPKALSQSTEPKHWGGLKTRGPFRCRAALTQVSGKCQKGVRRDGRFISS